jgi:hypothetical protein
MEERGEKVSVDFVLPLPAISLLRCPAIRIFATPSRGFGWFSGGGNAKSSAPISEKCLIFKNVDCRTFRDGNNNKSRRD